MKAGEEILSSILKTAQIGQAEIKSALKLNMRLTLRNSLESRLNDLYAIETEAYAIATQRGWELSEIDPVKQFVTDRIIQVKIKSNDPDSKIANILVQHYTADIRNLIKNIHNFSEKKDSIWILLQRLLDCEIIGIQQMLKLL